MNFKPGDLAFIVRARVCPENNGKIVELIRRVYPGDVIDGYRITDNFNSGDAWLCRSRGSDLAIQIRRHDGEAVRRTVKERAYAEFHLRPIRPQPDDAVDEMVLLVGSPQETTA